tara:strand:+ start:84 stop:527 length:444 start_codon:yes stop_codon:yes gene_type:complete
MNIKLKKKKKQLRRKSRSKSNMRFRDSKVGMQCPQCGVFMTESSPPGKNPCSVTIEHIQPMDFLHGGASNISNIEIICDSCNNARNKLKQKYELKGDILPDKFWYLSLYHELSSNKTKLNKIYPQEWDDLQQLFSVNFRSRNNSKAE